jgi:hypothetical protein
MTVRKTALTISPVRKPDRKVLRRLNMVPPVVALEVRVGGARTQGQTHLGVVRYLNGGSSKARSLRECRLAPVALSRPTASMPICRCSEIAPS